MPIRCCAGSGRSPKLRKEFVEPFHEPAGRFSYAAQAVLERKPVGREFSAISVIDKLTLDLRTSRTGAFRRAKVLRLSWCQGVSAAHVPPFTLKRGVLFYKSRDLAPNCGVVTLGRFFEGADRQTDCDQLFGTQVAMISRGHNAKIPPRPRLRPEARVVRRDHARGTPPLEIDPIIGHLKWIWRPYDCRKLASLATSTLQSGDWVDPDAADVMRARSS